MVNGAFESGLTSNGIFFTVGIRDDRKQVERGKPGNSSEQSETLLKASTADHQGSFTMKPLDK